MKLPRLRFTVRGTMFGIGVVALLLVAAGLWIDLEQDAQQKAEDARWLASPGAYQEERFWEEFDRDEAQRRSSGRPWWRLAH
jgi:hypothetical protein